MEKGLRFAVGDLEVQVRLLLQNYPELAEDEQLLEDMLDGSTDFTDVMSRLVTNARLYKANGSALQELVKDMIARREKWDAREKLARSMMLRLMHLAGIRKVVLPQGTVSIGAGRTGVVITDEEKLPESCFNITKTVSKTKVKELLDAGEKLEGATLTNGGEVLTLR